MSEYDDNNQENQGLLNINLNESNLDISIYQQFNNWMKNKGATPNNNSTKILKAHILNTFNFSNPPQDPCFDKNTFDKSSGYDKSSFDKWCI